MILKISIWVRNGIYMAHKISIWKHLSECCYYEQESGFRVHLYELLKDPSRIEQLAKDGYIILNRYLDRVDRAPEIDFLMALKVHFLDLGIRGNYIGREIQTLTIFFYIIQEVLQSYRLRVLLN